MPNKVTKQSNYNGNALFPNFKFIPLLRQIGYNAACSFFTYYKKTIYRILGM